MTKSFTKPEPDAEDIIQDSDIETLAYGNFGKFIAMAAELPWTFVEVIHEPNTIELDKTQTDITYEFMFRVRAKVPRGE